VVRVGIVSSTSVDRGGRVALWLHLAATGVVLTTLMALLADLPDSGPGTGPANSTVAAPDEGGQHNNAPAHPSTRVPGADPVPVRVLADVAQFDDVHPQNPSVPDRAPNSGPHVAKSAPVAGAVEPQKPPKSPETPPVQNGSSHKRGGQPNSSGAAGPGAVGLTPRK
jgi:hypothetical protein